MTAATSATLGQISGTFQHPRRDKLRVASNLVLFPNYYYKHADTYIHTLIGNTTLTFELLSTSNNRQISPLTIDFQESLLAKCVNLLSRKSFCVMEQQLFQQLLYSGYIDNNTRVIQFYDCSHTHTYVYIQTNICFGKLPLCISQAIEAELNVIYLREQFLLLEHQMVKAICLDY